MKHVWILLLGILLVACGGEDAEEASEESGEETAELSSEEEVEAEVINSDVLEAGNVGIFMIGQMMPNLPAELSKRKAMHTFKEEGEEYEVELNVVYNSIEDMVDLHMEDNPSKPDEDLVIMEIFVHSDYYQTAEGIGVHSTIEELSEAYPNAEVWYTYVSERCIVETEEYPGVQFILNFHDLIEEPIIESDRLDLELSDFKEGSLIEMIRVY